MAEEKRSQVQRVTVEYIQEQKALGWPDIHPEDHCHRCGNRNISWWIDSNVWNAVMQSAFEPYDGILCPSCFGEIFNKVFPSSTFELKLSPDSRGARAFNVFLLKTLDP